MPSSEQQILEAKLAKLFSDVLNVEVPSPSIDLFETGILDSQKFVELLLSLEEQFETRVNVEDFEIEHFRCLENIAALVLRRNSTLKAESVSLEF